MKNKRILLLVAIILIVVGGYFLTKKEHLVSLTYTTQKISEEGDKGAYKIDAEVPVITLGIPKKSAARINTSLANWVKDSVEKTKKDFKDLVQDPSDPRESLGLTYLGKTDVLSDFKTLPYINVAFETYIYSGGAHGISDVTTFVFDGYTGETISLSSLFQGEYLKTLSKLSLDALKVKDPKLKTYTFAEDGTQPIEDNFKAFTLMSDGMHIVFGDYQVGPYVVGRPEIVLSYEALQSVLKPTIQKVLQDNK